MYHVYLQVCQPLNPLFLADHPVGSVPLPFGDPGWDMDTLLYGFTLDKAVKPYALGIRER